jgi:protein-disulfide isomerase
MQKSSTPVELIVAIVLAAVLISGSLVFVGLQFRPKNIEIPAAIDEAALKDQITQDVLAQLQSPGASTATDAAQLKQEVMADILAEVQKEGFIDPVIDAGIQRYVRKQQEAQAKAREEQARLAEEKAKNVRPVSLERDHVYGDPEAIISLIEYSDFECPFCKSFHPYPKEVVDASGGKVNWVYRHYPLQFHNPGAQKQAEASECANELGGNEAFWTYADAIYERTTSNGNGFPIENLVPLAEEIGLDAAQFEECLNSARYAERVQEDLQEGSNSGITGTPGTILLNNETGEVRLVSGAMPTEQLQAKVDELLPQD